MPYQRIEIRQVGWFGKLGMLLGAALAMGIVAALVILSLGLAIILLPIVAIAALVGWWRLRKIMAEAREEGGVRRPGGRVIETEYEVVDGDRDDGHRR